jgi:hypothetical protein
MKVWHNSKIMYRLWCDVYPGIISCYVDEQLCNLAYFVSGLHQIFEIVEGPLRHQLKVIFKRHTYGVDVFRID